MLEFLANVLFLGALGLLWIYFAFVEYLDSRGRMEIIEQSHPKLWVAMNARPTRLVMLVLILGMLATEFRETIKRMQEGDPPRVKFFSMQAPEVQKAVAEELESKDSLRRRTLKAANEVSDFLRSRFENHPPYAYPQPSEPNPSDERKAAIKKCLEYDQATTDTYMRKYKDRMVGIIREYKEKGVATGFMESTFTRGVPVWAAPGSAWEDTPQNELGQFKELAFHVDAKDQLITQDF